MITPQIEMQELPSIGHMTSSTIECEPRDRIL